MITDWHGCYDDSWKGVIVEEAFAHPAKFAFGLISRIVDHGLKQGYWSNGDLIGDCFGGVALGGVICGARGINWVGCELEPRFVDLGNQNLAKHGPLFMASGATSVRLVQGDSRQFASVVGGVGGIVTSPPYADSDTKATKMGIGKGTRSGGDSAGRNKGDYHYGSAEGQIGKLKTGELSAVITSPPYADTVADERQRFIHKNGIPTGRNEGDGKTYGSTVGNIGNLKSGELSAVITSPPYADSTTVDGRGITDAKTHTRDIGDASKLNHGYGSTEGNIGNLKAGELTGIVTSPPYADSLSGKGASPTTRLDGSAFGQGRSIDLSSYGHTEGQIGNDKAESYWQAMRQVYEQCHLAIRPGGVMAVVVKDFVKGGKRVTLCDQTCELLEACGFEVFERTRCHLVKEARQPGLFGEDVVKTTSRKSFFRRLAEKHGSPEINWEEVIWLKR